MQSHAISRKAEARGDAIDRWFQEKTSAKTTDRKELSRLRAAVCAGEVRRLYIWKLDRLTRSGIRDTFELIEELKANGCELVTVADGFDLASPAAPVILAVLAWAAQIERTNIGERIKAGIERATAEGRPWGRPRSMSPAARARALELRETGRSVRAIAVALKVPRSTVERALRYVRTDVYGRKVPT